MDAYKVKQLKEMLAYEKDLVNGGYGAHLSYKGSEAAPIQLDAGGRWNCLLCTIHIVVKRRHKDKMILIEFLDMFYQLGTDIDKIVL